MPIVPSQGTPDPEASAVVLAAYLRHIQVCECSFYGVTNVPDTLCRNTSCKEVWQSDERHWLRWYLAEAQWEIEQEAGYFIGRRWVAGEERPYTRPILTEWGYVVSGGVRAVATISAGEAVDQTSDPSVIGPVATTVTDAEELHLYHPGTDLEITPSSITLAGGFATFQVPRCRTVKPEYEDTPKNGLNYSTLSFFADTVDVKRVYNVDDDPATLYYKRCANDCADTTRDKCLYIKRADLGSVWVPCGHVCGCPPYKVELNYYAGRRMINTDGTYTMFGRQAQDAIIRLAHVKMPKEPCDCDVARELWDRDRKVIVDGQGRSMRGVSPFGPEEGAWVAYRFMQAFKLHRARTL